MNSKQSLTLLLKSTRHFRPRTCFTTPTYRTLHSCKPPSLDPKPVQKFACQKRHASDSSDMSKNQEDHQHQAGDTTHREEDQWKFREPYRIQEEKAGDFDVKWEGQCHCGKVQYQLSRDKPLAAKYCHCTTCQRLHGAPFQWAAIFHKSDINFTHGHHDLGWYDPTNKDTSHHLPCKVSCSFCRSPIMDEGRNMILLFPPLIKKINTKEGRQAFKPTCHMFYPQRVAEFRGDGIVKWAGIDNNSDLIDDDENVLVKHDKDMKEGDMDEKKRKHLEFHEKEGGEEVKKVKDSQ
ncbi:Mss4-like protein [Exophiala viscosa]|uniref:Mss4-like protein n=1 Tax=Exophiala viscosa TaxID=2486360 RepID=A0AAN6DX71_9EURO|nr:Mss4-like protein [Exophiala viscosa]KAI1625986.1 Mss4-like protein [Exophiala viscosa]